MLEHEQEKNNILGNFFFFLNNINIEKNKDSLIIYIVK